MIRNYFKIAFRNLVKGKWYSALNIGGLGLVLAVSILLFWWVKDELSYDNFHSDIEQIYRLNTRFGLETAENTFPDTPGAVSSAALKSIPGVGSSVRVSRFWATLFRAGNNTFTEKGDLAYIDANFLEFFDGFSLLYGDKKNLFPTPASVILTKDLAVKFFGTANAVDKIFKNVENNQILTVSAVIEESPDNSYFKQKMYLPMQAKEKPFREENNGDDLDGSWIAYDFETFVKLDKNTNPEIVGQKLTSIKKAVRNKENDAAQYFLQPFSQLHLYAPDGKSSGMQQVKLLGLIAFLLLSIGCINYVNLTTARASRRNREVGIRKVVGAKSGQLAGQLMVESLLTLSLSLIFALFLIEIFLPFYREMTGKSGHFSLLDLDSILILTGALVLVFLLAGIYPALMIAGFNPIHIFRGRSNQRQTSGLRQGLVVTQFALSTILITSTLIIGSQLRFIRERNPGFNREHVFSFDGKKFALPLQQALSGEPSIKSITTASDSPVDVLRGTGTVQWEGKDPDAMPIFAYISIDPAFIPNFGIKILDGRNFDGSPSDSVHFMLNEAAVRQMELKNPIGKRIKVEGREGEIISVVKDFNIASLHETIRPLILSCRSMSNNILLVKTTGKSAAEALNVTRKLWEKYAPEYPFDYKFLDAHYNEHYKSEEQTERLFNFFAGIAIVISCLGLLGLVSFTAEQRTKEIGVRKVLGASVASITALLSKDFLKLVCIAIVIAVPVAWYFMKKWLDNFAFKVDIDWRLFFFAGLATILTAVLTISFQSIKAALMNPVKSLRSE
ncbi:ABC transporter permease [Dyadobacter sp. CY356]|uniref:ABC transporter permease n=1 Tax=Dyadobacter sp. CY356 TaxID=2906442 RepID=UPI001F46E737|nr:ABC transporter permease [Dyadobacter sp. CY356]MCF0059240.1 FtsX-like permease family protein [Dyadobacter sp. CY356]